MARAKTERIKLEKGAFKRAMRFYRYLKPYKALFIVSMLVLFCTSVLTMAYPYLLGQLFGSQSTDELSPSKILMLIFMLLPAIAVLSFLRIYTSTRVTEFALSDLRKDAFKKLTFSSISFFDSNKVGELSSRVATDLNQLQNLMVTTLAEFIRQIITIVIGIVMIALISTKLLLIMLSSVPVVIVVVIVFGRYVNKLSKKTQDVAANSNNILTETLAGIKNVKSFGNEFFEMARYGTQADSIRKFAIKRGIASGLFAAFIIFGFLGVITFVIYMGHSMTLTGELSKSEFFTIIFYTAFLVASLTSISGLMANVQQSIGATERLMDLLDNEAEKIDSNAAKIKLKGEVRFSNVDFHYETRKDVPVLRNVSFEVPSGNTVAIVGASGAGKSTITSLLLRFYDVTKGGIFVDEKNIMEYDLSALRSQMAIVPQEVMLFAGTIKENIAYGNPEATDVEIIDAANKANASEFINSFPDQMETLVGDRGIQLSGGQKQRIAIARAVLKNPTILILDEATSSLDSESERLVQGALDNLMINRTSIVIAHRLSTIRKADNILVLNKGELVESGTHAELVEKNGAYAHLSKIQFNA